jgi:hypothetical protein
MRSMRPEREGQEPIPAGHWGELNESSPQDSVYVLTPCHQMVCQEGPKVSPNVPAGCVGQAFEPAGEGGFPAARS